MVSLPPFSVCRSARREPLAGCQSSQSLRRAHPYRLDHQAAVRFAPHSRSSGLAGLRVGISCWRRDWAEDAGEDREAYRIAA